MLSCDTIANPNTINRTFSFDCKENLEYLEGPVLVIVVSLAALFLVTQGISPPKANAASIRPELPIAYLKTPQCEGQGHVCLGQHTNNAISTASFQSSMELCIT